MKLACLMVTAFAALSIPCFAQTGRGFVTIEGYVGLSREVQVGRIVVIEQIDVQRPLSFPQDVGKPYRIDFEVNETIRGDKVKKLDIVLALQSTRILEYMRDHHVEIMLVAGPNRLDNFPSPEVGVEEQGKPVEGEWFQFRILEPVPVPPNSDRSSLENQINVYYDQGRIFTVDLSVVRGRSEILKRARSFAKKVPSMLSFIWYRVPNPFGAICGDPNAYCLIILPVCSQTERTLVAILRNPNLILDRMKSKDAEFYRNLVINETLKALTPFPSKRTAALVKRYAQGSNLSKSAQPSWPTPEEIKVTASELLISWKM